MKKHDKHHDGKTHMKGGGVLGIEMKKYGRNLARAMYQQKANHKSGGRGR